MRNWPYSVGSGAAATRCTLVGARRDAKAARKRVLIDWNMGKSPSSIIVWIAPAAAVFLLNASLTFVNVWPTPAITWRGGLSLEFAVCVLALCIAGSRNRVHS